MYVLRYEGDGASWYLSSVDNQGRADRWVHNARYDLALRFSSRAAAERALRTSVLSSAQVLEVP